MLNVEKYKTEPILLAIVVVISIILWFFLTISIIGIIYAVIIMLAFFITHLSFIAYVRGSAIKISEHQLPELHIKIKNLSEKIGLWKTPDAYVMQAGGSLNALATKLFSSNFIVLYSDLLEACEDNESAKDFIIGHELGHLKSGHLSFAWLLLPGLLFPIIGTALSRAREFTCDRFGYAVAEDKTKAIMGLTILAAGKNISKIVNLNEFVKQQEDLNTGLMTLGRWLATHPPLSERISELNQDLSTKIFSKAKGRTRAAIVLLATMVIPTIIIFAFIKVYVEGLRKINTLNQNETVVEDHQTPNLSIDSTEANRKVQEDFNELVKLVDEIKLKTSSYPPDEDGVLSNSWKIFRPGIEEPIDPYDGKAYGYYLIDSSYVIWSSGQDSKADTEDDIYRKIEFK